MFVYIEGRAVKLLSIDEHDVCRINKGKQHIIVEKLCFIIVLLVRPDTILPSAAYVPNRTCLNELIYNFSSMVNVLDVITIDTNWVPPGEVYL